MKRLSDCLLGDEGRYDRVNNALKKLKVQETEITVHPQEAAIIETCNWSQLAGRAYAFDARANTLINSCAAFIVLAIVAYFAPGVVTAGVLAIFALYSFWQQRVARDRAVLSLHLADEAAANVRDAHTMINIDALQGEEGYKFTIKWGEKKMRDDFELGCTYEINQLYEEVKQNRRPSTYDFNS